MCGAGWKRSTAWGAAVLVVLMQQGAVSAEEPVATVTVTAPALTASEARAPTAFTTVIDASARADRVETAADALADTVGVRARRFGGLGAFTTISIRGSSANQVDFYLDGVPLSRARNETVNVTDLPLDGLDRIEVYRGTVPIGFSGGGLGGVVNLVTKPPSTTPTTQLAASYGSFSTRKVVAERSQQLHGIDLFGHVSYLGSQGDFTFLDDNGTPLNPHDDRRTTRQNNAFDSVDLLLKGGGALAERVRLDLTSETFFKDQGVPGIGSNQSRDASFNALRALNYLRLTAPGWLAGALDVTGALFGSYERDAFTDRQGELGTGNQDRRDVTTLIGGSATATYYPLASQAIGSFVELSYERFAPFNALATPADEPNQTRWQTSVSLQHQAGFFDERVLLVPTIGYQHLTDAVSATFSPAGVPSGPRETTDRDLWNPSIGAQVRVWPSILLRGNLGRFERAPSFSELFGNRGALTGNPALDPETGINRDIGIVATFGPLGWLDRLRAEYAYFNRDVDDLIVLVQNSQRVSRPSNIGSARIRGHELTVQGEALRHLTLDLNFTHQDAENRSPIPSQRGKQLPGQPADELYTRLALRNPRTEIYYEFDFIGDNFLDPVNFMAVPSRDIHTFGVALRAYGPLRLSFEARNVTDNQISDVGGFPLPGRSFFGTATMEF